MKFTYLIFMSCMLYSTNGQYQRRMNLGQKLRPGLRPRQQLLIEEPVQGMPKHQLAQLIQSSYTYTPNTNTISPALTQNMLYSTSLQQTQPNIPNVQAGVRNIQYIQNTQIAPSVPTSNVPVAPVQVAPIQVPEVRTSYPAVASLPEMSSPCIASTLITNPLLPSDFPISGLSSWAPMPRHLPSSSQGRGHFLKKIPIPPPTL